MTMRKGGPKKMPPELKRVKIAPSLTREAIEALRAMADQSGESQADVLIRLVLREHKRLEARKGKDAT
jgi:hypothetical protein